MSITDSIKEQMSAQIRQSGKAGSLTHGQQIGSWVWNSQSQSLEDAGNPNDPAQQAKWAGEKSNTIESQAEQRSAELWDPNSQHNRSLLDYSMKFVHEAMPTTDEMYGAMAQSGVSNPGAFAGKWNEAARAKAEDQGLTMWQKELQANQAQSEGYLDTALKSNEFSQQMFEQQDEFGQKMKQASTDNWLGVLNQGLGLGGSLLSMGLMNKPKKTTEVDGR